MTRLPRRIHLPFGTSLEFVDPLERNPYLTCASPVSDADEVLAMLHAAFAGDAGAREALLREAREHGFGGDPATALRLVAGALASGAWGLGSGRDVVPVVLPNGADLHDDDFEPSDTATWSVFGLQWSAPSALVGTSVDAQARSVGVPDGVFAHVQVFERRAQTGESRPVGELSTVVRDGTITASWQVDYPWDRATIPTAQQLPVGKSYEPPRFFFTVRLRGRSFGEGETSGLLAMVDNVELSFEDIDASPLAERRYRIVLADGETREGSLMPGLSVKLTNIAPGPFDLEFARFPEEF